MARPIVTSVEIPAPIEEVWDRLASIESHAEWMSDATSVEFLDDLRTGVGTTIRVRTAVGPLRADDIMRFDGWNPPTSMSVVHVGRIKGSGEFRLEPAPRGTTMTWVEDLAFPWYLGGPLAAVISRPILRRIFRANLARFEATFG